MKRVLIIQETLPSYRVALFSEIRSQAARRNIEVRVVHGTAPGPRGERLNTGDLPGGLRIDNRYFRSPGANGVVVWQPAVRQAFESNLVVVEQANRLIINYCLLAGQRLGGPRVAFWGHGRNFQATTASTLDHFKDRLAMLPRWWFAYTDGVADYLTARGYARDRITVVGNTIDVARLREEVLNLRQHAPGSRHRCVFIGGLYPDKRLDVLFDASDQIARRVPDFDLCIAGSGEGAGQVQSFVSQRPWAHYLGAVQGTERSALLASARLLLIPGLVGLVALDSLAAGVPLVTLAVGRHSPEIEYLKHDANALIVPIDDDATRFSDAVVDLLTDEAAWTRLSIGAFQAGDAHMLKDAAARFVDGLSSALD